MSPTIVTDPPPVTPRLLRPLLGSLVTVDTMQGRLRGTLLSCVKASAWLVVDDSDVVLHLEDIVAIRTN